MTNNIFKETAITSNVFESTYILKTLKRSRKIFSVLENLIDNGMIVILSSEWKEQVFLYLNEYDDEEKSDLETLIKMLDDRNRISICLKKCEINSEENYINELKKLNSIRKFEFITGTSNDSIITTLDNIDRDKYQNLGGIVVKQSLSNMKKLLAPVLSYAEKVTIIDPYFDLKVNRYLEPLESICSLLSSKHNNQISSKKIIIHTSIKPFIFDKEFEWIGTEKWVKTLKDFKNRFKHNIEINIWEDKKNNDQWHDRWIITNQCGLSIGKGVDKGDWTNSTWSILNWEEIPSITSKFETNRSIYRHIGIINSNSSIKIKNPENISCKKTKSELEKEEREFKKRLDIEEQIRLEKVNKKPKNFFRK